jgi:hypothetical protein
VFIPTYVLRYMAPDTMTVSQQREADARVGEIFAALSLRNRSRLSSDRRKLTNRSGGLILSRFSKVAPEAACGTPGHAA